MKSIFDYFSATVVVTIIILLIYAAVQQEYRSTALDPQIALATEIKINLERNHPLTNIFPQDSTDLSTGEGVFAVLFDNRSRPIRSSAVLDGQTPNFPAGIFEVARTNGEDRVTWSPRKGIRMALVLLKINNTGTAFVAAGRSLVEVEKRESNLLSIIFVAWLLCMAVIAVHAVVNFFTMQSVLRANSRKGLL